MAILNAYARSPVEPEAGRLQEIEIARFERVADQLEKRRALVSGAFWQDLGKAIDRSRRVVRMNQIGQELVEIAEVDIPLSQTLSSVSIHHLEQDVHLERVLRLQAKSAATGGVPGAQGEDFLQLVDDEQQIGFGFL